ncbi:MAG TPA: hypothetical protein V6D15_22080 [Oculatellaceae cyanobacterium]
MFVETLNAISTGVSVVDMWGKFFPTFKKIFKLLKNGNLEIVIIGAGGTGKTTLGNILSKNFDKNALSQDFKESISIKKDQFPDNIGSIIVKLANARLE